jgi:hypothetical protein
MLAALGWVTGILAGACLTFAFMYRGDEVTGAHGVVSPCGFYNIVTIHADGTHRAYPDGPPSPEVMTEVNALPPEQRSTTIVPCPTMQVPQREAKSKNTPEPSQAREASGYDSDRTLAG